MIKKPKAYKRKRGVKKDLKKRNHVVLLSGLGSSLLGSYKNWANLLESRLKDFFKKMRIKDVVIWNVSSDGKNEDKIIDEIMKDYKTNTLGFVVTAGHSNGARDQLKIKVPVDYCAVIDMTLGEFGIEANNNIKKLDEFHAVLEKVNLGKDFDKQKYSYYKIKNKFPFIFFHSRLGTNPKSFLKEVYDKIFYEMSEVARNNKG